MELFSSKIASIDYFEDINLIRTSWKKCDTAEEFMPVIREVMGFYELLLPRKTLWNQTDFSLHISPGLQKWTENTINIPSQRLNVFEKISFVVSKDTMSQMSVMQIFDDSACDFIPRYFVDEDESMAWLTQSREERESLPVVPPTIIVDRVKDRIRLSIEVETEEFDEYIRLFDKLWKERVLSLDMAQRLMTLSSRERTVLKLLVRGKNNDFISDVLSISPHTVKTHRKNIYRKLACSRVEDLMRYSLLV